jgi:hypothetical protein
VTGSLSRSSSDSHANGRYSAGSSRQLVSTVVLPGPGWRRDEDQPRAGGVAYLRDQAQLYGILDLVRNLGLELVSVVADPGPGGAMLGT